MKRKRSLLNEKSDGKNIMEIDKEYASIMLKRQFENGICRDQIELIAEKDNQRVSVPRLILTAASNYFAAQLGTNFREGNQKEFHMEGFDGITLKTIVDFIYTGCINLTEENVGKFFAIANGIELDLLEEKCCRFFVGALSVTNATATWLIADKFNNANLRQKAFDVVCESFEDVPSVEIQELEYRLFLDILKNDKVQATEEFVFNRLSDWMEYKESDREQHIPELLKLIQLKYIPEQFLYDKVAPVYQKFNCSGLLFAESRRRASGRFPTIGSRRGRSIYCLFKQQNEAEYSAIKVEKYHSALNSWNEVVEISLGDRKNFGWIFFGNKVYILGGVINSIYVKSVSAYDLSSCEEKVVPEMNQARCRFASTSFGKFIYVFGGLDAFGCSKSCERYDAETNKWKQLKAMNVARQHAVATVMNDYIFVAGGKLDRTTSTNVVELYDPKSDEWVQIAPMSVPRCAFTLVKSKAFLYAIGSHAIIEKFNPLKYGWSKVQSFTGSISITSAIEVDGDIFVIDTDGEFKHDDDLCESKFKSNYMGMHYLCQN